jgi:tetratricopeptide (TPR) repeat protein
MKTCFVVQGFGKKTDFTDGRVLDLDASYAIIKDAVLGCGLACLRADEIPHSGTIDVPMYEQLLRADLVIADLSTYNVNAAFELGVRYALRPHATLIVAEEQLKNPFDFSHLVIRRYRHLGEDLGAKEARRFTQELQAAIRAILSDPQTDSPIYTFFPRLQPPCEAVLAQVAVQVTAAQIAQVDEALRPPPAPDGDVRNTRELVDAAQQRLQAGDAAAARELLNTALQRRPHDVDITLRLAEAITQDASMSPESALQAARECLRPLDPDNTNNPETLALWGRLHAQLWAITPSREYLDEAIQSQERVYFLRQDPDVALQLAHLLDTRAVVWCEQQEADDALTDHRLGERVRRELMRWAPLQLADPGQDTPALRYRLMAALWCAAQALGDDAESARWDREIGGLQVTAAQHAERRAQAATTDALLRRYRELQSLI